MSDGSSHPKRFLAGELAKAVGVSRDTLRHYERKGVLARPVRAANGYRLYPESALARVVLIRRALSVGFTLDELAQILGERDKGGAPCRRVRSLVAGKLSEVEAQLTALAALRDELRATLADWDARLSGAERETRAHLLDALVEAENAENRIREKINPSPKLKFPKKKVDYENI